VHDACLYVGNGNCLRAHACEHTLVCVFVCVCVCVCACAQFLRVLEPVYEASAAVASMAWHVWFVFCINEGVPVTLQSVCAGVAMPMGRRAMHPASTPPFRLTQKWECGQRLLILSSLLLRPSSDKIRRGQGIGAWGVGWRNEHAIQCKHANCIAETLGAGSTWKRCWI
jgi:hypothetical protein